MRARGSRNPKSNRAALMRGTALGALAGARTHAALARARVAARSHRRRAARVHDARALSPPHCVPRSAALPPSSPAGDPHAALACSRRRHCTRDARCARSHSLTGRLRTCTRRRALASPPCPARARHAHRSRLLARAAHERAAAACVSPAEDEGGAHRGDGRGSFGHIT